MMRLSSLALYMATLVCSFLGMSAGCSASSLTVKTAQGNVQGTTINKGKVRAFLGLPYAAPPLGDFRWKAHQPLLRWKGVRPAAKYGARCMQGTVYDDILFQDAGENEYCLYLNVYAPAGEQVAASCR